MQNLRRGHYELDADAHPGLIVAAWRSGGGSCIAPTILGVGDQSLTFSVLGPLEVLRDGEPIKVGGAKARAALAMLVLEAGRIVSNGHLIEGIWGEEPPDGVQATLQVHVSNLRKALGADVVVTRAPGYLLDAGPHTVDLLGFDEAVRAARALRAAGQVVESRQCLGEALGRWRGAPLGDLIGAPFTMAAIPWLEERRAFATEEHAEAGLDAGAHREVVGELEAALGRWPLRERLWGQLIVALYRSGRQADALGAYQRARTMLADDLGIDPGPELRRLEGLVLAQDPSLDFDPKTGAVEVVAAPTPAAVDAGDPGDTYRVPAQANFRLELENGDEMVIEGIVAIGRHPDCDVTLLDSAVSRRHVELRPALGGYLLVDLGSTNGTLVNGAPVVQHLLTDGDLIAVGAHQLRYHADPA